MNRFRASVISCRLHFAQPAGTSRGVFRTRDVWYVLLTSDAQPGRMGIGECAPLPGLSPDALPRERYEQVLYESCRRLECRGTPDTEALRPYPSILFGLETALRHYQAGSFALWDTPFSRGEAGIPINGLIWMDTYDNMLHRIEQKLGSGFRCLKLKIGAIGFEEELALLKHIRSRYPKEQIEIRVDANGAFLPEEAPEKLTRLAALDIHSIEQPIRAGQWDVLAQLARNTPVPIALDEELTGVYGRQEKRKLLETVRPRYIILKPSLHGGFAGCAEWIEEAGRLNIGWWITSALESNIGLNAIAQWTATLGNPLPQGLGTGQLFTDNTGGVPLAVRQERLWFTGGGEVQPNIHDALYRFLADWFSNAETIDVQTSGSTGIPKRIEAEKSRMKQSARITCDALGLQPGDKALLCMPLRYIAGKMMVVRAVERGMTLLVREPSGHPLKDVEEPVAFAAMTPLQVCNTLQVPEEKERLKQIKTVIIGGGEIPGQAIEEIKDFPNTVYATYGMTETLSHIALRQLNGGKASACYTPLPSVSLSLSEQGTLCIDAPLLSPQAITTNDMAELLPGGGFRILGRTDNVINSGGIKIHAEALESKLRRILPCPFAITSLPHRQLGEAVTLLVEGALPQEELLKQALDKYEYPRYIWQVEEIPLTATGKTDRKAVREQALSRYRKHTK